jgi:hypothetical protein
MAILDEDNLNLANYNEKEASKQLGYSGDTPDAISRWARSFPPETSEVAFKDFINRSFLGTPPQSVEEKDLLEWTVGHLKMHFEFDMLPGKVFIKLPGEKHEQLYERAFDGIMANT